MRVVVCRLQISSCAQKIEFKRLLLEENIMFNEYADEKLCSSKVIYPIKSSSENHFLASFGDNIVNLSLMCCYRFSLSLVNQKEKRLLELYVEVIIIVDTKRGVLGGRFFLIYFFYSNALF